MISYPGLTSSVADFVSSWTPHLVTQLQISAQKVAFLIDAWQGCLKCLTSVQCLDFNHPQNHLHRLRAALLFLLYLLLTLVLRATTTNTYFTYDD